MFVDSFHGFHYFWIAYFCDIELWAFNFFSMKLLTYSKNLSITSKPLQWQFWPCSFVSLFGFEISYTGSRPVHLRRFFLHPMKGGPENQPMTEREAGTEIMMRIPWTILRISKGFHRSEQNIYTSICFCLWLASLKI